MMRRRFFLISSLIFVLNVADIFGLPPPDGIALKRAKQISGNVEDEPTEREPPPNLKLRSRMMAAMNSKTSPISNSSFVADKNIFSKPLILKKTRKGLKSSHKVVATTTTTTTTPTTTTTTLLATSQPVSQENGTKLSQEESRKKLTNVGDDSINLKVRPVLKTNFVDANGRVVHDVVSVPIRVSDGHIHSIAKSSKNVTSSSSLVETDKNVNVAFRSSLPVWLI